MAIVGRDSTASETQNLSETTSAPSAENGTTGSGGLSTGAKAGIAIAAVCGVAIIAVGFFLYLRRRRRNPRKSSSLETGNKHTSRQQRQRQKQLDKQHKQEQEQLQQQLQQMQLQLQKQKLEEQEARQKQLLKELKDQEEESKYVAELFELPGWMPERRTPVNELADTGQPRYEMITEANTAEMAGGPLDMDNEDDHIYGHFPRRSRSYTAELSGGTPIPPDPEEDEEMTPLKRSQSDGGPIISPADHTSPNSRRVFSPYDVSPPTATVPGLVFSRGDWRSGGGFQVPTSSLNSSRHPAIPLGLSLDPGPARVVTGKRSKGQRLGGWVPGDIASQGRREAWA
jgi:hypothetical protein